MLHHKAKATLATIATAAVLILLAVSDLEVVLVLFSFFMIGIALGIVWDALNTYYMNKENNHVKE